MTKKLADVSFVIKFDHLKSYLCKGSKPKKSEISFNLHASDSVPNLFSLGFTFEGMKASINVRFLSTL